MNYSKILKNVVDIIYPPRCPICGNIVSGGDLSHKKCLKELKTTGRTVCLKCGKKLHDTEQEFCEDCTKRSHYFERGVALYEYDDAIKKSIYDFKYSNRREYAAFYADELFRRYEDFLKIVNPDIIIPIPIHSERLMVRGYNQSEVIAKELSKLTGIKMDNTSLVRVRNTIPLKELDDKDRKIMLKEAFLVSGSVRGNTVLLVDDIYTTGATLDECALLLKKSGAKEVYFMTVCIGKGY